MKKHLTAHQDSPRHPAPVAAISELVTQTFAEGALDPVSQPPLQECIAELEQKLAARERTIAVLMKYVRDGFTDNSSNLAVMQQNIALEQVVEMKTWELDTEHKRLQAALYELQLTQSELIQAGKMTAIGQLAAGIAHEINTPIQFVSDNTHFVQRAFNMLLPVIVKTQEIVSAGATGQAMDVLLQDLQATLKRSKAAMLLQEIPNALSGSLEGILRVTTIVKAMKDFSHPSKGVFDRIILADAIKSTIEVTRNAWRYVADVDTDFDPDMPLVPCLRDELNQVILNLIVNAADAIEDRAKTTGERGKITIRTRQMDSHAEISVTDTGCGIPEAIRSRIFEPFFTTKVVGKGSGQGLALAYQVIRDNHAGEIRVESEPGQGSTFYIRLPLHIEETES